MLPRLAARVELDAGTRTFASGLLLDLVSALRRTAPGDLIAVTASADVAVEADLEAWSRLTGHRIVGRTVEQGAVRWVIRHGAPADARPAPPRIGERLWVYLNFDCNLQCDYCCVRSSPKASRRALGLEAVQRIAVEAATLGVREIFATGGEPFLLPDIDRRVLTLAEAAPVTVLTNGMLFRGPRLANLKRLPRNRVALQISLDSPDATLHDAHRGRGSWQRAVEGIEIARGEGFRVRLAATVATEGDQSRFHEFLDRSGIPVADRVVRRVALRGFATSGFALSRADLVPEITITAAGVYWHPVGADDDDLLVTRDVFPLADAFAATRRMYEEEHAYSDRLATIFHCA